MKLSKETIAILKNFAQINQSIQFEAGNTIRTISPSKSTVAIADISEEIPSDAAIYDLSQFLSVLSAFNEPEIEFGEKEFVIKEGKKKTTYSYVDPSMILTPKKKTVEFPATDVAVDLPAKTVEDILKQAGVLGLPDIAFVGDGEKCFIQAMDAEGSTNNVYKEELGETSDTFRAVITASNLKIVPQSYKVEVSKLGISKFEGENGIVYYVAVSAKYSDMG